MRSGRFRYLLDPLCAGSCLLYAVNRWGLKPHSDLPFLRDHFDDLLLIPCALPVILWIQRRLGWRTHDRAPDAREIALHLVVWAVIAEGIGPFLLHRGTADLLDVVAYVAGALVAAAVWKAGCPPPSTP